MILITLYYLKEIIFLLKAFELSLPIFVFNENSNILGMHLRNCIIAISK